MLSNNRSIDAEDLLMLKQHLLNMSEIDAKLIEFADMNDDGIIDGSDMTILMSTVLAL